MAFIGDENASCAPALPLTERSSDMERRTFKKAFAFHQSILERGRSTARREKDYSCPRCGFDRHSGRSRRRRANREVGVVARLAAAEIDPGASTETNVQRRRYFRTSSIVVLN
jgi:hypothetical protein